MTNAPEAAWEAGVRAIDLGDGVEIPFSNEAAGTLMHLLYVYHEVMGKQPDNAVMVMTARVVLGHVGPDGKMLPDTKKPDKHQQAAAIPSAPTGG